MRIFPEFRIGLLNGWIPLVLYLVGFILSVSLYSKESRLWLFNNPIGERNSIFRLIRLGGQWSMIAFIGMMVITPLNIHHPIFLVGAGIYAIGYLLELSALHYFRMTPAGEPVVAGPYRVSRNPQWVGLFLVLLGSAIATGVWLYIGMVGLVGLIYHIQILDEEAACTKKYGDRYRGIYGTHPKIFSVSIMLSKQSPVYCKSDITLTIEPADLPPSGRPVRFSRAFSRNYHFPSFSFRSQGV